MAMKFHPASEKLPMLGPTELQELADDITANGLHSPIELYEGMIIDGRNRYEACRIADVEPDYITIDAFSINNKPFAYVWSMNGTRRHLTPSQKAMAGQELLAEEREEAKQRQKDHGNTAPGRPNTQGNVSLSVGKATDKAGSTVGVSGKLVAAADKVVVKGTPELARMVTDGEIPVTTAAKLADAPKSTQRQAVKAGPQAVKEAAKHVGSNGKPKKNGAESIRVKDRKNALLAFGKLVKALHALGIKQKCVDYLNLIHTEIETA